MGKSEAVIQREIANYLESSGWYVVKLIQTNKNGIPDLMAIKNGRLVFIEVKRAKCIPRVLQTYRIKELEAHGAIAFVAHNLEELKQNI